MEQGGCQYGVFDQRTNTKTSTWQKGSSWRRAVELYTFSKLTYERDRLKALLDFTDVYAKQISASVQNDYIASLWKNTIELDLLWMIEWFPALNLVAPRLCRYWDSELLASVHRPSHEPETMSRDLLT